jgi:hypothetical protein
MGASGRGVSPGGSQGNCWNNVSTGVNTVAPAGGVYVGNAAYISCFGHVGGPATIYLAVSADGVNFYQADSQTLAGASDFAIHSRVGAGYVALMSSASIVATGSITFKDS